MLEFGLQQDYQLVVYQVFGLLCFFYCPELEGKNLIKQIGLFPSVCRCHLFLFKEEKTADLQTDFSFFLTFSPQIKLIFLLLFVEELKTSRALSGVGPPASFLLSLTRFLLFFGLSVLSRRMFPHTHTNFHHSCGKE